MGDNGINVFVLPADELRQMIAAHAESVRRCIGKIAACMFEMSDDVLERAFSRRETYKAAIVVLERRELEARYLLEHVSDGTAQLSAAELIAFRKQFSAVEIDLDALAWTPAEGISPDVQAERRLGGTLVKVPAMVLPPGVLK